MSGRQDGGPLHRRTMEFEVFDGDDALDIVGRLQDERPWADGTSLPRILHRMELRVSVAVADLVITEASASMLDFPHAECPAIEPAFTGLIGLSVARGYTRAVQQRFGGVSGCSHLEHLARLLGPVVVQAVASYRAKAAVEQPDGEFLTGSASGADWLRNTCHVWAEGGIGPRKLAAGWRPGGGPVPAPPLEQVLAERDAAEG